MRIDDAGEVQARGSNVFTGYWANEEKTKEAFTEVRANGQSMRITNAGWLAAHR